MNSISESFAYCGLRTSPLVSHSTYIVEAVHNGEIDSIAIYWALRELPTTKVTIKYVNWVNLLRSFSINRYVKMHTAYIV